MQYLNIAELQMKWLIQDKKVIYVFKTEQS